MFSEKKNKLKEKQNKQTNKNKKTKTKKQKTKTKTKKKKRVNRMQVGPVTQIFLFLLLLFCGTDCSEVEFQCVNGLQCIDMANQCDGFPNCVDRSDEMACGEYLNRNYNLHILRGHNWVHFAHRPWCTVTLNSKFAILKTWNCFQFLIFTVKSPSVTQRSVSTYVIVMITCCKLHLIST